MVNGDPLRRVRGEGRPQWSEIYVVEVKSALAE
jgi:hypothetical protein